MRAADGPGRLLSLPDDLIRRFAAIEPRDRLAIAVSGGSDSVGLMHLTARWLRLRDGAAEVTALTVDHGLRAESAFEASRAATWAAELGFGHETLEWRGAKPESGVPEAARDARYGLLGGWCAAHGVGALLLAHTLSDQAETMLMHLVRGSGVDGLAAMAELSSRNGVTLARPLLDVWRDDLRTWLRGRGVEWFEDPSNEDRRFERIRVRDALRELEDIGLTQAALARTARRMQRSLQALEALAESAVRAHVEVDPAGFCRVSHAILDAEAEDTVLRVLGRCLSAAGGAGSLTPGMSGLEALVADLRAGTRSKFSFAGCLIERVKEHLFILREPGRIAREPQRLVPGACAVWDGRFAVAAVCATADDADCRDITVRPLPEASWSELKASGHSCRRDLRNGLVSFWRGGRLAAVPHIGYRDEEVAGGIEFSAHFCNKQLLGGAQCVQLLNPGNGQA